MTTAEVPHYHRPLRPNIASPSSSPSVRFADEHQMPHPQSRSRSRERRAPPFEPAAARGRRDTRYSPPQSPSRTASMSRSRSRSRSRGPRLSRSPSRSRSPPRRRRSAIQTVNLDDEDKPWFKKKTVWSTVATLATVAALVPASVSARASSDAAAASRASARASTRSAQAVEKSTKAAVNSSVAQGHQDHHGRYTGPRKLSSHGSASSSRSSSHRIEALPPRPLIQPGHYSGHSSHSGQSRSRDYGVSHHGRRY